LELMGVKLEGSGVQAAMDYFASHEAAAAGAAAATGHPERSEGSLRAA